MPVIAIKCAYCFHLSINIQFSWPPTQPNEPIWRKLILNCGI